MVATRFMNRAESERIEQQRLRPMQTTQQYREEKKTQTTIPKETSVVGQWAIKDRASKVSDGVGCKKFWFR